MFLSIWTVSNRHVLAKLLVAAAKTALFIPAVWVIPESNYN
jgi:hypothetical protein